jgi:hypothetical protein
MSEILKCTIMSIAAAATGIMIGASLTSKATNLWMATAAAAITSAVMIYHGTWIGLALPIAMVAMVWFVNIRASNKPSVANEIGFGGTCGFSGKVFPIDEKGYDGKTVPLCANQTQTTRIDPINCPKDSPLAQVRDIDGPTCESLGGTFVDPVCTFPTCDNAHTSFEATDVTMHPTGCTGATLSGVDNMSCRAVGGVPMEYGCRISLCSKKKGDLDSTK